MKRTMILWLVCLCRALCLILPSCGAQPVNTNGDESSMYSSTESSAATISEGPKSTQEASGVGKATSSDTTDTIAQTTSSRKSVTGNITSATNSETKDIPIPHYAITKSDSMLSGAAVSYSLGKMWGTYFDKSNVLILSSEGELDAFVTITGSDDYDGSYKSDFFQTKSLIIMTVPYTSSSFDMKVNALIKNNGELRIETTTWHPAADKNGSFPATDDYSPRYLVLEVKKEDISGVTKFSYCESFQEN